MRLSGSALPVKQLLPKFGDDEGTEISAAANPLTYFVTHLFRTNLSTLAIPQSPGLLLGHCDEALQSFRLLGATKILRAAKLRGRVTGDLRAHGVGA